jgi:putative ABC transport system substrate-binding protein
MPIVFAVVSDPIGAGFVKSMAPPGGNITGFTNFEETMGGKWLELLREIGPSISRASMLFNPETANAGASGGLYLKSIETAARVTGTELIVSPVRDPAGIDEVFAAMAQGSSGGVLVMPNTFTIAHRERIVAQAARYEVPTIYHDVKFVAVGGLLSYGVDVLDLFRRAATYADRIVKGANPADLPVQQPTKFELAINTKTAKALGLTIPPDLLVAADEVIEQRRLTAVQNVCFWHLADHHDRGELRPPLGVKQTSIGYAVMSASDPKRTS